MVAMDAQRSNPRLSPSVGLSPAVVSRPTLCHYGIAMRAILVSFIFPGGDES